MSETYETHAKGIRILPGQWRPHYPWEHIAWVSPPWPSQDYVWLDFPEALFTNQGLLYLSHVNPGVQAVYPDWPKVDWRACPGGIEVDRELPNGVAFGASVTASGSTAVSLRITLRNGSAQPLTNISLQTCAFLRACREFADYTMDNKFVHVPEDGWLPFSEARALDSEAGRYSLGWRGGPRIADWPVLAVHSNQADRWALMTWHHDTLSLVGNPGHPCFHADPKFRDLDPGQEATILGSLMFAEGPLEKVSEELERIFGA